LFGAHKAAEALGSTCIEAWASRSQAAAAGMGEQSLWAPGVTGLISCTGFREGSPMVLPVQENRTCGQQEFWADFPHGLQGVQSRGAAGSE
jgi:hypothetical protein